jgi:hypothetical protein
VKNERKLSKIKEPSLAQSRANLGGSIELVWGKSEQIKESGGGGLA